MQQELDMALKKPGQVTLESEWLKKVKTFRAFSLLGFISQFKENFIFKGGTSLLLHVPKIKRLSIDNE